MIRLATEDDLPDMLNMAQKFFTASQLPGSFDPLASLEFGAACIENSQAVALVSDRGMILGSLIHPFHDPNWVIAVELLWWAEDGSGIRLLREFERWGEQHNADEIRLSSINHFGDAVQRYATRRGGKIAEQSYSLLV